MPVVTLFAAVHLLAAASGLVVIATVLGGGEANPLRRPLVLLAADQFAWNAAAVGFELTGGFPFALLGAVAAPLFPPIALHFVLVFVGRRKQLQRLLIISYVSMALTALLPAAQLLIPGLIIPGELKTFGILLLVGGLPIAAAGLWLVIVHLRRAGTETEKLRTQVLLVALVLVTLLLPTEPLADSGLLVPRLSTLGSLVFNALLVWLTMGLGLFRRTPGGLTFALALLGGLAFAVTYLALFIAFSAAVTAFLTAFIAILLTLGLLAWLWWSADRRARTGLERFASVGRFSAQMAHDLKNPLAAAKGAAEFLTEEMRRAGGGPNHDFAQLVVQQLDRLHAVIDRYQRLAALEPQLAPVDVKQLVTSVLSLQTFATTTAVTLETSVPDALPVLQADRDLVASALENLVKNAFEAMPKGGTVTVAAAVTETDAPMLELSVSDTGTGFDARAREQAFELFFTSKAQGSGLGLAFVRQVARAHGGDARLSSREGKGSTVTLVLPVRPPIHG